MTGLSKLSKQLKITIQSTPEPALTATADEQAAIKELVERANKIIPGVRVRFVERSVDTLATQLNISLVVPNLDDSKSYELYGIPFDMDEKNGINLVVAQTSFPTEGRQLLRLKSFLPNEALAADLIEPKSLQVKWENPYRRVLLIYLPLTLFICLLLGLVLIYAQSSYPFLFGAGVGPSSGSAISAAKSYLQTAESQIDVQLKERSRFGLSESEVARLEHDKILLEKARQDLQ